MTHDQLEGIIGPLAQRLTQAQVDELAPLAASNPAGLARMVAKVEGDPNVDSVVGTLLHRARRGDIRQQAAPPRRNQRVDSRDWARRLYLAKMTDLAHTTWDDDERVHFAIDYALDHCRASGDELRSIERDLHAEHGLHLTGHERDFERDTPHRALMHAAHGKHDEIPGEPA